MGMNNKVYDYILRTYLHDGMEGKLFDMLYNIGCNFTKTKEGYIKATCFNAFQCGFVNALFTAIDKEHRLYLLA